MDTATPPTAEEREARIRDQVLQIKERRAAAVLRRLDDAERRERKLRESWDGFDGFRSLDLVIDRVRAADHALGHAPISTVNDRRFGHNWPFWRTWQEHAGLRASARVLEGLSSLVPGALRGLQSYVIGTGYTYRATSKNEAPDALVAGVQDVIDEFLVLNSWAQMEKEGFYRSRRDGELFHEHTEENGRLLVGVIEPEEVYPPAGDSQDWSYGIRTVGRATNAPLAYAVIDSPLTWETRPYSAEDVLHFKCNVDARVKRGKTDLCYDTADIFRTAGRLADHIGVGATIQASIAVIRQHAQADAAAVQNFARAQRDAEQRDSLGQSEDVQLWESGTELNIDAGQEFVVPPFASNVTGFLAVVKGILQCVAVRWNAPEWLVSADASNNNYASSITAESPFVKRCYSEQEDYKAFFLRSVWKAIQVAAEAGRIVAAGKSWGWLEVRHLVDVQAEAPNIEVRDDAKTATTDKTYIEAGVKSVQTTQQELGLDGEQEAINIRQWQRQTGQDADASKTNDLTAPTVLQLQQAYYSGQLPRVGAVANMMLVFGLSQQQAETVFPEVKQASAAPLTPLAAAAGQGQQGQQQGGGGDDATAGLRGSVGGSQSLLALQQAYYGKQLPRDACIANARIVFGFGQPDAEALFPEMQPDAPADPQRQQPPGGQESRRKAKRRRLREAAEWEESKHKRADDGRFGSGGGHGGADPKEKDKPEKGGKGADKKGHPAAPPSGRQGPPPEEEGWTDEQAPDWGEVTGARTEYLDRLSRDKAKRDKAKEAWVARTLGVLKAAGKGVQNAVQAAYDRLPPWGKNLWDGAEKITTGTGKLLKNTLSTLAAAYHWVEHHTLGKFKEFSERLAIQAAKERGLPDKDVKKVGDVVRITDNVYAWTANIPLAHELLHHVAHIDGWTGFGLAKIGYFTPLASVLYTMYSTARNPLATLRAAGKVLMGTDVGRAHYQHKKSHGEKPHAHESSGGMQEPLCGKDLMGELLARLDRAGDGRDWYYALFCQASGVFHDARKALAAADEAFAQHDRGDELAGQVTPEEYAQVLDDYEPPEPYQAHKAGGRESAEWSEEKHQRADNGQFGSGGGGGGGKDEPQPGDKEHYKQTSAAIKAKHGEGKQAIQAEHRKARKEVHAKHAPAKAEIEADLKDKVAGEKEKGKAKLKKLKGRQKKLKAQQDALKAKLAVAEKATDAARAAVDKVRKGGGYLGDLLDAELAHTDVYSARELGEELSRMNKEHPWDPAQDEDWSATDYDEKTDSEQPIHTPEETAAEKTRRDEARAKLRTLGVQLLAHGRAESRGAGLEEQIDALDEKLSVLDDQRQQVVDGVNAKLAGHRKQAAARHEQVKQGLRDEKDAVRDAHAEKYEGHKAATRAELEKAKDAHRAAKESRRKK